MYCCVLHQDCTPKRRLECGVFFHTYLCYFFINQLSHDPSTVQCWGMRSGLWRCFVCGVYGHAVKFQIAMTLPSALSRELLTGIDNAKTHHWFNCPGTVSVFDDLL